MFLLATCFAGSSLGKTLPMQAVSEVPVWTPGCYARFSRLHRVLLIAADLWKLGNRGCTTQRLLTSPAFPHSHFQRFHRFWCADWLWRTAGAGSIESQQPPPPPTLSFDWVSHGTPAMLFIAEMLCGTVQFCMHANSSMLLEIQAIWGMISCCFYVATFIALLGLSVNMAGRWHNGRWYGYTGSPGTSNILFCFDHVQTVMLNMCL